MKFLKLSLVAVISLLIFPQLTLASSEQDSAKFYMPETSAAHRSESSGLMLAANDSLTPANEKRAVKEISAKGKDVAGFVIAANGTLTATNADGVSRELARRSQFYSNEVLKTGKDSSAQLRFKDRALMTLRADSELNIEEYHFGGASDPDNKSIMNLVSGGFRTISGSIGKADKSAYRITTPAASIGIRGTDYELIISIDGKVFAAVHDGGITLVNDIGDLDLGADSDYLFAEVGAGQSPLGLTEMPDVFKVEDGKKVALSDEQKAQLAKKLAEGKEKFESLLADLNEEGDEGVSDADRQQKLIAKLIAAGAVETRISPELLEKIKSSGRFAINANGPAGEIVYGKSYTNEQGETVFLTSDNRLYAFKAEPFMDDGNAVPTGHPNVFWGRWNKGEALGLNGIREGFDRPEQFFMSAVAMDAAKIQSLTDTVELNLAAFSGTTHYGSGNSINEFADIGDTTGSALLDFDNQTVSGDITVGLLNILGSEQGVDLTVAFNGNMLSSNNQLNNEFNATASVNSKSTTASVQGVVVAPTDDEDINTAGFAGGFEASLPTAVSNGLNVNVRGMFVFSNIQVVETKPYF